jgi:F0F1-type ATP synthase assembly protein I
MASQTPAPRKPFNSSIMQLAMAMQLPVVMIASILVAGGIGYLLDRWLHTSPVLTLVLGFLGFGAGVWEIIRRLSRSEKTAGGGNGGG